MQTVAANIKEQNSVRGISLKNHILIFLSVIILSVSAGARDLDRADIKGHVRDAKSGESLPYANISVQETNRGTTTNNDGYFVLVDEPVGIIRLIVQYIGYETQIVHVENKVGGVKALDVRLQPKVLEVDGVTVTANAEMMSTNTEISQITLSPKQLASLPSIGETDVFRSLQLLPGVSGVGDGGSGLYVRGGTPDQNLVLFDGMTIYHVDHFFGFFSAFNADAIKDIQLMKGGYPAEYGGRLSSVVNLTGKSGDQTRPRFTGSANLLSLKGAFEYPLKKWGTFLIAGRRSYTDFIQSPLYDSVYEYTTGDDEGAGAAGGPVTDRGFGGRGNQMQAEFKPKFYFYDLNSKLTITPTDKDRIAFSFYSGKDDLDKSQDFSGGGMRFQNAGTDVSLSTTDFTKWGNVGASGSWARQWSDRFRLNVLGAYSKYYSNYDRSTDINGFTPPTASDSTNRRVNFGNATQEDNDVHDASLKMDADWQIARSHRIRFGIHASALSNSYNVMANDTTTIFTRDSEALLNSAYMQDKWNINKLDITAGLRAAHYNKTSSIYWEPRASLSYELSSRVTARAAWGHYYQFVNQITNEDVTQGARDFWMLADESIKPSFSEHVIAGLSYENSNYVFSVEAYQKNLKDLVEFSRRIVTRRGPGSVGQPIENFFVGDGLAQGVEFLLQKKRGAFTGWLGYTLGRINHTFQEMNDGNSFPALHDRTHELNLVGKYTWGIYTFAATWVYATGSPYTAPASQYFVPLLDGSTQSYIHVSDKNALRLPAYQRLDISASRKFESEKWAIDVGLSVFNAYNHKNIWYRDYNLDTTPITITDVLMMGFTPTIFAQFNLK